jgi:TonB family protein
MKRTIVGLCVFLAGLWFGATKADAMTEFCPATVESIESSAGSNVPSTEYSYELNAKTSRSVADASIIADTDHGWYKWSIADVAMPAKTESVTTGNKTYQHEFAQSSRLQVVFPDTLLLRHAWITTAKANYESVAGWEKIGETACEVPTYNNRGVHTAELARAQSRKATPSPPPAGREPSAASSGAARAVPTTMPFDSIDCDASFRQATVTAASRPDFPPMLRDSGLSGTVLIAVAVDRDGHLIDASVYASSGFPAFDSAGLRAARMSSYSGPISYCQKVRGEYLFNATFQPRS